MSDRSRNRLRHAGVAVVNLCLLVGWVCGVSAEEAKPDAVIVLEGGDAQVQVEVRVEGGPVKLGPGARVVVVPAADGVAVDAAGQGLRKDGADARYGTTHAVFFNEEREIGARLRKAAELVTAGKLQQALDLYLYVMEHVEADVLFRLDDNRFAGARDYCIRSIMQLPEGLLRQYRLTVDGDVERLYEQARLRPDPDELEELAVRCYVSSHGPAMLDFAGDVYAARGESDRAASCWGRLLRWGPSTDVPAELVEAKLVLALVRSGRLRAARRIVDAVNARAPDTQVTLAGERRKAVPYLSAALAGPAGGATRKADDARRAWSQFGGDAAHDRTMPAGFKCDVKVGELLIPGYDWKSPGVPPPPTGPFAFTRATASSGPQPLPYAPFHPVYGGGRVFIHDDRGVMAFRVGAISPDWVVGEMGEPGEAQRGRVVINGVVHVQPGGRGYACAYENGVVYASLHDAPGGREVWAVSEKGTILWRITADREDFGWLADTSELSDPVVFDGRLYFCAWQSDQYGRGCSLVCVDAADGRLNWQRFICSGPIARYYRSGRTPQLPAVTLPAAADGHVVVCSNVGGIAALDARTGELQWGFAYEQTGTQFTAQAFARDKLPTYVPGSSATPLVHQGVVYVAPADAARFYALDLDTGRRLWDTPRGDHDRIVGLIDDRLIVSGRKVAALDATTGGALWVCEGQDAAYAGHGFITTDAVYIPGSECIYRLDPKGGDLLGRLLVDREAGEYGNLLLIEDTVVQVGRRASYYGEWESVHARLAQEVALHPDDPFPQIKLAVIYARREDRRAAIRHFERALELTAGLEDDTTSRLRGEVRRRLYTIYAAEVEAVLDEGRTDVAFPLAVRCETYATTDDRRIEGTMRVLGIHEMRKDWGRVVVQLQSLIERAPRVIYAFDGTSSIQPALYGRLKIAELMAEHGRGVYATFEERAARLYEKGLREDLENVVRTYPNSTYALRALRRLGTVDAASGDFRQAADHLSRYLRLAGQDAADAVQVGWELAHYHEGAGRYRAARRVLLKLAETHPDVAVGPQDNRRRLADVVKTKLDGEVYRHAMTEGPVGAFHVPLAESVTAGSGGTVISTAHDDGLLLVDHTSQQVRDVDGTTGRVTWRLGMGKQYVMGAQVLDDRVLMWSRADVKMLDSETGAAVWTWDAEGLEAHAPNVGRVVSTIVGANLEEGHVAVNLGGVSRELVLLDAEAGGKVLWKKPLPASPMWAPVLWQDRVAVITTEGLVICDRRSGDQVVKVSSQRPRRPPVELDDGRILLPGFTKLECVDLTAGKVLWSAPTQLYHVAQHMFDGLGRLDTKDYFVLFTIDRRVVCVDLETGETVWSRLTPDVKSRPVGVRVEGDAVYVAMSHVAQEGREARVLKLDLKTGRERWTTPAMEGGYPVDFSLGRDTVAVLANIFEVKKVGQFVQQVVSDPAVFCVDKETGKVVQRLDLKGEAVQRGRSHPSRIIPVDEMLWVVYNDRLLGLKGPP